MRLHRRSLTGLLLSMPFAAAGARTAFAQTDEALSYYRQAKIDWRQAAGKSLTIGMNKHPFTESLLPLLPQFKALTGIAVDYLILPEDQYFPRLAADLSSQQGQFPVIMTGPMRNWEYVSADWIVPLDDFLANPKLTDPSWYKHRRLLSGVDRGQSMGRQDRRRRRQGFALLHSGDGRELHPCVSQGHLRPLPYRCADDLRRHGRGGAAGEEERRHSPVSWRAARRPSRAWAPASSAGSSRTPTISGAS